MRIRRHGEPFEPHPRIVRKSGHGFSEKIMLKQKDIGGVDSRKNVVRRCGRIGRRDDRAVGSRAHQEIGIDLHFRRRCFAHEYRPECVRFEPPHVVFVQYALIDQICHHGGI